MTESKRRQLIVNADDFGRSAGINRGIMEAHERGIVTSASLMVRWPDAVEAVAMARRHEDLSLGLHLDLGEWRFTNGEWVCAYEVVPPNDPRAIAAEVADQMDRFRRLTGREPTHIDSHQHAHGREPVRSVVFARSRELGIPLRDIHSPAHCRVDFFGQSPTGRTEPDAITTAALITILASLPDGLTELTCHPAAAADIDSTYVVERIHELAALCDPAVARALALAEVDLVAFGALSPGWIPVGRASGRPALLSA